jgi:hypothetical protein
MKIMISWVGTDACFQRVGVVEGGNMAEDLLVFPDPWWDLRGGEAAEAQMRTAIADELRREVGAGHPLTGGQVTVVARCTACDDVVVALTDGPMVAWQLCI